MSDPNRKTNRQTKLSTVVYFSALGSLILAFLLVLFSQYQIDREVADLKVELAAVRQQSRKWDEAQEQASADREVLMRVLQRCRRAEDIPNFGGPRIIANQLDGDAVGFYVPQTGSHQLRVKTSWEIFAIASKDAESKQAGEFKTETMGSVGNGVADEPKATGKKWWTIDLNSGCGYLFVTRNQAVKDSKLGWRLRSNSADFSDREEELPLPPLSANMTSWSSYPVAQFPNRVSAGVVMRALSTPGESSLARPSSLRIGRWTKQGAMNGDKIKIYFDLEVLSDGPPVILTSDVESFSIMGRRDLVGDYLGAGAYELRLR